MESLLDFITKLFSIVSDLWCTIAGYAWDFRILIFIIMLIFVLIYRIAMANFLYIKRHDKADWVIWGIFLLLQVITIFIPSPPIWLFIQSLIVAGLIVYAFIADKLNQAKTTIYSNNLVYEDSSDKYAVTSKEDEGVRERKELKRSREGKISRSYSFSRMHMIMGVPVLMMKLKFRISTTVTQEQIGKMVKQLSTYYQEYNWRKLRTKGGIKYEVTAEVKVSSNLVVPFDKSISDELDWYVVPMGSIDVSNKATAKATPYVWMMHDPKTEGKQYQALAKTQTFATAPQAFIVGSTGGGKSVLLNTIIAHFVNKAKQDSQTELYLADAKRVEFRPYEALEEVAGVAVTIDECRDLLNKFREKMYERNQMMEKEGIKSIPLDGKIQLKQHIDINGHLIYGNEVIEFKTTDGQVCKDYAMNLNGRTDIAEINIPEPVEEEEDDDKKGGGFSW